MPVVDRAPLLVVEDDDLVRSFLCRALTTVSGDIDACGTGAEAMHAVSQRRYGVILLDGLLPDIHGIELARRMLGQPNASRSGICFVSGSLRLPQAMHDGVSALPKPLRVRELIDGVEMLLDWHDGTAGSPAERLAAIDALSTDLVVG
jgi:DNA-binding response OmpR family regulator